MVLPPSWTVVPQPPPSEARKAAVARLAKAYPRAGKIAQLAITERLTVAQAKELVGVIDELYSSDSSDELRSWGFEVSDVTDIAWQFALNDVRMLLEDVIEAATMASAYADVLQAYFVEPPT